MVGLPDAQRGETVTAFVALRPGQALDLVELQAFVKPSLSPFEIPKALVVRPSLPKTAVAKLSRQMLRDEHLSGGGPSADPGR